MTEPVSSWVCRCKEFSTRLRHVVTRCIEMNYSLTVLEVFKQECLIGLVTGLLQIIKSEPQVSTIPVLLCVAVLC